MFTFCYRALLIFILTLSTQGAQAAGSDLLRLMEKLDQIDKQDFQSLLKKANDCIKSRDFTCAEDQLRKSKPLAVDSADKQSHASAVRALGEEKNAVAQENIRIAQENKRRQEQARRDEEMRDAQAKIDVQRMNCERLCPAQFDACMANRVDPNFCDDGGGSPAISTAQMFADTAAQFRADRSRIASMHNNAMANIQAQQADRLAREQQQREMQREQQRQESERRATQLADARNRERAQREQDEARAREQRETERVRQEAAQRERERTEQAVKKRREAQDEAPTKEPDVVEQNPYERYVSSPQAWGNPTNGWLGGQGWGNTRESACSASLDAQAKWIARDEATGYATVVERSGCICGTYSTQGNATFQRPQWTCVSYHKMKDTGKQRPTKSR